MADRDYAQIKADTDASIAARAWRMPNGASVADWLGTASVAAQLASQYLADVRNGVAGSGRLIDARAQLTQSIEECDAILTRLGQMVDAPQSSARIESVYVELVNDSDGDSSWLEQTPAELGSLTGAVANRRRLQALERGEWHFVGARLAADVVIAHDGRTDERLTLTTPGLWSIESDSDADYFREVALEDWDCLAADLAALGLDIGAVMPPQDYNIREV